MLRELVFISMYEMMQLDVLKVGSVITDIGAEIPRPPPVLMNWLHENATK